MAASAPRVAIVGAGMSGTLAALVLRSRGITPAVFEAGRRAPGGRLLGGRHADSGVQFLRARDKTSSFASVLKMLQGEGMVAKWRGRFGMLGV